MSLSDDAHEIPGLVGNALEQVGKLVQNEAQLAKAEIAEKLTQIGKGAGLLAGAAILAIPVLVLLLIALALWLSAAFELSPPLAHLVAAGVGALCSVVLAVIGASYLKSENLKPQVTLQQLQRDATVAKEIVR